MKRNILFVILLEQIKKTNRPQDFYFQHILKKFLHFLSHAVEFFAELYFLVLTISRFEFSVSKD
jgi:hypothetical protein